MARSSIQSSAQGMSSLLGSPQSVSGERKHPAVPLRLVFRCSALVLMSFGLAGSAHAASLYWVGAAGGNTSVASNWKTTNPTACGGGDAGAAPGSADVAIFDADCDNNAAIDANLSVAGIDLNLGYVGTVTQNAGITVTVGSSNYVQAAGTFSGGNSAITLQKFTLSGGTFTSTSGTLTFGTGIQETIFTVSGGTFTHNSGTVTCAHGSGGGHRLGTIDVVTSLTLNNLTINGVGNNDSCDVATGDTLVVVGTLTLTEGNLGGPGTVEVQGGMTHSSAFDGSNGDAGGASGLINITGAGTRTINITGGGNLTPLTLNAANVTLNGPTSGTTIVEGNLTIQAGTFVGGAGTVDLNGVFTQSGGTFTAPSGTFSIGTDNNETIFSISGGSFNHNSGTILFNHGGINVRTGTVNVVTSLTLNNLTINCPTAGSGMDIATGDTLIVAGTFTQTNGFLNGPGALEPRGNVTIATTADGGDVALTFAGTAAQTYTNNGGNEPDGTYTINKTAGTVTLATNMDISAVGQDLTVTAGTLNLAGFNLTVNDVFTLSASGTLQLQGGETVSTIDTVSSGSTVTYDGTASYTTALAAGNTYSNLTFNGSGGVWEPNGAVTVSGTLTLTAGTFDLDGQNLTNTGGSFVNNATLRLTGGETLTGFTNDTDSGTVAYDGAASYTSLVAGNSYNHLTFNGTGGSWIHTATLDVNGTLTITAGTVNSNGQNVTLAGDWSNSGTYTSGSNTVTFDGSGAQTLTTGGTGTGQDFQNLTVNKSAGTLSLATNALDVDGTLTVTAGTFSPGTLATTVGALTVGGGTFTGGSGTHDINGAVTISSGTLTATSGTMTVSGNFTHSGGTFTHNSGTVTLDGTDQTLSGATTFNNLSKTVTTARTLTFPSGASSTQTVVGTWTAKGASGALLSLRSSTDGTQWRIDPQGTRSIEYLDVKDSNNVNATGITTAGLNITDSGNNTGWNFNSAPSAANLTTPAQATDGSGYASFQTLLSDPDNNQTRLRVQYSLDDGSNWRQAYIASASSTAGNVTVSNGSTVTYQLTGIPTNRGNALLTVAWNTKHADNGGGAIDSRPTLVRVRVTPNDSTVDGTAVTSSRFQVDDEAPRGLTSFSVAASGSTLRASWTPVAEEDFSHYELWYGRESTAVAERDATLASEWDQDNDRALTKTATVSTTIAPLSPLPDGTYTVKLWAADAFGNEATLAARTVTIDTTAPTLASDLAKPPPSLEDIAERIRRGETPSRTPTALQLQELEKAAKIRRLREARNLQEFLERLLPQGAFERLDATIASVTKTLRSAARTAIRTVRTRLASLFGFSAREFAALRTLARQSKADPPDLSLAERRDAALSDLSGFIPKVTGRLVVTTTTLWSRIRGILVRAREERLTLATESERRVARLVAPAGRGLRAASVLVRGAVETARRVYAEPLRITDVSVADLTKTSAVVTWQTNRLARGKVNFGPSPLYGEERFEDSFTTRHRLVLRLLPRGTKIFFEVLATDLRGQHAFDAYYSFTTPGE
ncbi:MAG: RTX toxins and related Ca2+-binding domain [Parcubacteria group bacterium Gr01-1014_38]|nr:MAG: RTX toxins and related Ca2+-binding domain [Parcubacteria group bacterium Gr01-1014_38]